MTLPPSRHPLQRHWGERNRQFSARCRYTPTNSQDQNRNQTPLTWIPVHATRDAVISATGPLPMPAVENTGGHYMRSGRVAESSTTGGSVSSPGHGVQPMYAGSPSLRHYQLCMHPCILERFLRTRFNPLHSYPPNFFH